jgi:hypothetical protein
MFLLPVETMLATHAALRFYRVFLQINSKCSAALLPRFSSD